MPNLLNTRWKRTREPLYRREQEEQANIYWLKHIWPRIKDMHFKIIETPNGPDWILYR